MTSSEMNTPETIELNDECEIEFGSIPASLIPCDAGFQTLWDLHPAEHSTLRIHGKTVEVPRWDRAYEKDYPFSNSVAKSIEAPAPMKVFLDWAKQNFDHRINGMFVNWHDGQLNHYHGKHRDSTKGLVHGSSIITVSLGEERVFRLRPYQKARPIKDFVLKNGDFIVIPWKTNQNWTHEIPKFARHKRRRISVTLRAFE